MKKLIIILLVVASSIATYAQTQEKGAISLPSIQELEKTMSKGTNNAFVITLEGISKKNVESEWKDFSKQFKAKAKKDRKTKEWLSDDAKVVRISDNTVDIYADINEGRNESSAIAIWFDLGGAYVNSTTNEESAKEVQKILQQFVINVYKHQAEGFVKVEEKTLASFEKDFKKLEKDKKDYLKKIEDAKATIAKMEKNIEVNEVDQQKKLGEISEQKEVVTTAIKYVKAFDKL